MPRPGKLVSVLERNLCWMPRFWLRAETSNEERAVMLRPGKLGADGLPEAGSGGPVHWTRGELIGAGAFGRVYMGLNNETGQLMAVKQVRCSEPAAAREAPPQSRLLEASGRKTASLQVLQGHVGCQHNRRAQPTIGASTGDDNSPAAAHSVITAALLAYRASGPVPGTCAERCVLPLRC